MKRDPADTYGACPDNSVVKQQLKESELKEQSEEIQMLREGERSNIMLGDAFVRLEKLSPNKQHLQTMLAESKSLQMREREAEAAFRSTSFQASAKPDVSHDRLGEGVALNEDTQGPM